MKGFPYLLFFALALAALGLWGWKILHEASEPPAPLVQDMMHRPLSRAPQPPPPGTVPLGGEERTLPHPSGEALFLQYCAVCHGAGGSGQSFMTQQADMPEVSDLTTTTSTPDTLYRTLTEGRGSMPAFGTRLSNESRRRLIQYIETLHQP